MWEHVKKMVNLTPHEIAIWMDNDTIRKIPPSGKVVRLNQNCHASGTIDGIPVTSCVEYDPKGIPEPEEGTVYLVSSVVAKKVKRPDVLSPDTSDDGAIRDGNGYIVAVKRLQCFAE